MLTPTTPQGSTYRLFYRGAVDVAGVNVQQFLDLSSLPDAILEDRTFVDNWRVFVQPIDPGITEVSSDVTFTFDPQGRPLAMVLTLSASAPTDRIDIEAWYIQSGVR